MGYFSNGSAGCDYETQYCDKCVHQDKGDGCAIWLAHLLHGYEECNNQESILHILIPRNKDGQNGKCKLFITAETVRKIRDDKNQLKLL